MIDADGIEWIEASRVMMATHLDMVKLRTLEDASKLQRMVTCGGAYLYYRKDRIDALVESQ